MATLEEQIAQMSLGTDENQNSKPVKLNLGNGVVFDFNNDEELSANVAAALSQVRGEVETLKATKAQLEQELINRTTVPSGGYVTRDEESPGQFDMNVFIAKMQKDPPSAFNYVDEFRESKFTKQLTELESLRQENEVNKFLQSHPEFPGGQAAYILDSVRQDIGQPMTKVGLEAALAVAVQSNKLPDFRLQMALNHQNQIFANFLQQNGIQLPQMQQPGPMNNVPQQNYRNPYPVMTNQGPMGMPTVPGRASNFQSQNPSAMEQALEAMPLEQLEKLLKQNNMI